MHGHCNSVLFPLACPLSHQERSSARNNSCAAKTFSEELSQGNDIKETHTLHGMVTLTTPA